MNDKMTKTSISSIIALDIIDFSKKTEAEQAEVKSQFDGLINLAVIDIPEGDRVILNTAQGAVIACSGPLEDALEDALFISLTVRDEILKNNTHSFKPLYVQFGINLGSVQLANKKGEPDIIGEGVDEAKRIMSFANPNQILVSRVYHEMASKLTQEISKMFEQYDMHALEQEIYAVRPLKDKSATNDSAEASENDARAGAWQFSDINWKYATAGLFVVASIFMLARALLNPIEPTITMDPPVVAEVPEKKEAKPETPVDNAESTQASDPAQIVEPSEPSQVAESNKDDTTAVSNQETVKKSAVKKKTTQKVVIEAKVPASSIEKPVAASSAEKPVAATKEAPQSTTVVAKPAPAKTEKNTTREKSGWQNFKDSVTSGSERNCTQAEIAMNQCAK